MKQEILEYLEGTPDIVHDTKTKFNYRWGESGAKCFGLFPINLDGGYKLMVGEHTHLNIAQKQSSVAVMGKALNHINERYHEWIGDRCYDKSYALGRYWEAAHAIAFWYLPSSSLMAEIIKELGIDPTEYYLVTEMKQDDLDINMTVAEYIQGGFEGDEGADGEAEKNEPWRIDPRVVETIRSYNKPNETWQSMKEKEGWNTLAQRNAMIYQEGKERVDEYFKGDPDTIDEYDDYTDVHKRSINFRDKNVISFGFFDTSLEGEHKFIYELDICHHEICKNLAENIIGKAMGSEDIGKEEIRDVQFTIYRNAAYKGRIFLDGKAVTTWNRVSSSTLRELLNLMGGVDKWADFNYIVPRVYETSGNWELDSLSQNNINIVEYIESNIGADESRDIYLKSKILKDDISEWLVEIIERYNAPSSVLANKTAKLGNMTIAQYNSLLNQEEKEPKQTIKENDINMKNNKYQEEFSSYISIMTEALKRNDYKAYEYASEMLNEAVQDSKHEDALAAELNTNNFGILNHIFEERLPELFKNNKKVVKDVIKLIKEDINLSSQFNYYNAIRNYHGKIAEILKPEDLTQRLYEAVVPTINKETLMESNAKFRKVLKENNIIPTEFISDEMKSLYESGHNIITKKRSVANVATLAESTNNICEYMNKHKNDVVKESVDPNKLIKNFENKLKDNLTESEMSFVQQITDFRSPIAEQRKEKLFNKFKNECINKINEMLKEDSDNVELKGLSDQINEMKFNKESIVKDIAKLLEIRDILMDD